MPSPTYVKRPFVRGVYESPNLVRLSELARASGHAQADRVRAKGQSSAEGWARIGDLVINSLRGITSDKRQAEALAQRAIEKAAEETLQRDKLAEDVEARKAQQQWQREQFRSGQADAAADVMVPGQSVTPAQFAQRFAGTASEARFVHEPGMEARLPARPTAMDVPGYATTQPQEQPWAPMAGPSMSMDTAARPERFTRQPLFTETLAAEGLERQQAAEVRQQQAAAVAAKNTQADNVRADLAAKRAEMAQAATQRHQEAMERIAIQKANQALGAGELSNKQMSQAIQLTNSLKGHPAYTDMADIATGWTGVQTGLRQQNGFGDITAINAFQRMVDPGATVREGDVVLLQTASGLLDKILTDYPIENLRKGSKLPQPVRDRMAQTARELYAIRSKNYNETVGDQYRKLATSAAIPFELIGQDFKGEPDPAPKKNPNR